MTPSPRHWYLAGWLHHPDASKVATVYDVADDQGRTLILALQPADFADLLDSHRRRLVCLLVLAARQCTPSGERYTPVDAVRREWRRCAKITDDHHRDADFKALPVEVLKGPHGAGLRLTSGADVACDMAIDEAAAFINARPGKRAKGST